ncbi:hypothetical protein EDC04DRAFT_278407 [Pisolithus marmoratus]|nr:hypothetical protein EDC04DRAFT_278407 [Pisolithus marmoratus]
MAIQELELLASSYSLAPSRETYKGIPAEGFSRMPPTVIKLWTTTYDRLRCFVNTPLKYLFLSLNVIFGMRHLVALPCATDCIRERHSGAVNGWSPFSDQGDSTNFSRKFRSSSGRTSTTTTSRDVVLPALNHDSRLGKQNRRRRCTECRLESEANIEIAVHE